MERATNHTTMSKRQLGQLQVSAQGLGCMGMSFGYGGSDEATALRTLHAALDLGINFWDTAEVYGPYTNEQLLGRALAGRRDQVVLATKFGFKILPESPTVGGTDRMAGVDSRPKHIREVVHASLKRLQTDRIDLLYQHRVDPQVPIEDVVGTMADLVREGKVLHLGLSEVSAATLRRAHAVHAIAAVQSEYSLWSREVEDAILPTCRELGVGLVAYSPLGRGALTGQLPAPDQLAADDFRRGLPRFQADAWSANQAQLQLLAQMAQAKDCSAAQLALAWVMGQGPHIVPIPGARRLNHLQDNAAAATGELSDAELAKLGEALHPSRVAGDRYTAAQLSLVNG